MRLLRLSILVIVGIAICGSQARSSQDGRGQLIDGSVATHDDGLASEPSIPVDPIVEEPIRPLYPQGADPSLSSPRDCGPLDVLILPAGLLVLVSLRCAPCRHFR